MAYYVYILYSLSADRFYIGQTSDMSNRLQSHNSDYEKATAPYIPWVPKCTLEKTSRGEAMILDKKLKNLNRKKLFAFIEKYN